MTFASFGVGVLAAALSITLGAGAAVAAPAAKGGPGKPGGTEGGAVHGQPNKPSRPHTSAAGASETPAHRTQVVFVCSYECPDDGGPCAWVMRAETRLLPRPASVR